MTLHLTVEDGPLAGSSFEVVECPTLVRCVRSTKGKVDILNLDDDEPRPDEQVYWYRWAANGHICGRPGGCITTGTLTHQAGMRDLDDSRRERQLAMPLEEPERPPWHAIADPSPPAA